MIYDLNLLTSFTSSFGGLLDDIATDSATISDLAGTGKRIIEVIKFQEEEAKGTSENNVIDNDHITLDDVKIVSPSGRLLVNHLTLDLPVAKSVVVMGPSGCGKSSLLRVLAGLWNSRSGTVSRPLSIGREGSYFLPQKPYIVVGSIAEQICFPNEVPIPLTVEDRYRMIELLKRFDLQHLADQLDQKLNWGSILSSGEAQRLSMLRVLWHKPAIAILDECTSSVNLKLAHEFYQSLKQLGIAFFSVAHDPSLVQFHDFLIQFDGKGSYSLSQTIA